MRIGTPENTREFYVSLLDRILAAQPVRRVYVAGAGEQEFRPGEARASVDEDTRLKIILSGVQPHSTSRGGKRMELLLRPGQALFWAPHAWSIARHDRACVFLAIVFRRNFVRALIARFKGGEYLTPPPPTPYCYHTATALRGPALHVMTALSEQSRQAPHPELELHLFQALLRFVRDHIQADESAASGKLGKALYSWQRAMEYMRQNFAENISRDSVAAALEIHPNYLSALCRSVGKRSFHDTLENIRIERARHLLRTTELKVERIAQLSGYHAMNYFIKVFKQNCRTTPGRFRYEKELPT